MKQIIFFLFTLMVIGCGGANKNNGKTDEAASERDTVAVEDFFSGSRSFFGDSIYNLNPELMTLYDSLYDNICITESSSYGFLKKESWMKGYCKKLADYYDAHDLGMKNISVYAKADTVLNHIHRLISQDDDTSTMGMVVQYGTESKLNMCRGYAMYLQMKDLCKEKATKGLLEHEWKLYHQIYDKAMNVVVNTGSLYFWGGSIIGPFVSWKNKEMIAARIEMYRALFSDDKTEKGNVHDLQEAKMMLLKSYSSTLDEVLNCIEEYRQESPEDFPREEFEKLEKDARRSIKELDASLEEWIKLLKEIGGKLPGTNQTIIEQAASSMMIRWTEIAQICGGKNDVRCL